MYQITGIRIPFVNMIDVQLTVNFNLLYACIQTIDIMRKSIYLFKPAHSSRVHREGINGD